MLLRKLKRGGENKDSSMCRHIWMLDIDDVGICKLCHDRRDHRELQKGEKWWAREHGMPKRIKRERRPYKYLNDLPIRISSIRAEKALSGWGIFNDE